MRGPLFDLIDYFRGIEPITVFIYSAFGVLAFLFICIPIHECSHALAAKLLGDDTADRSGRLTLNPFAHIDLMGVIIMFVCSIGWAKPTPISLRRCTKVKPRTANVIVSAAGPLSNVIMAYIFMMIFKLVFNASFSGLEVNTTMLQVSRIVLYVSELNTFLAIFNLLPIPPFDGYHILASFLPAKAVYFMERNAQIINYIVLILIVSGVLRAPLGFLSLKLLEFLDLASAFLGRLYG